MKTTYQKPVTDMYEVGNRLMLTESEINRGVNSGDGPDVSYGGTDQEGSIVPAAREEQTFEFSWE